MKSSKIRNYLSPDHPYAESKTACQWGKVHRIANTDAIGELFWSNKNCVHAFKYYRLEDTHEATENEMEEERAKAREYRKKLRDRKRAKALEEAKRAAEIEKQKQEAAEREEARNRKLRQLDRGRVLCLDCETTGLSVTDEILQLAIIDGHGNTLFNCYFRPVNTSEWPEAEAINGISPKDVEDELPITNYVIEIQKILKNALLIVGYNSDFFDLSFLSGAGIEIPDVPTFDVMTEFAPIYGEWSEYHRNYKWQKLSTCANYYGYTGGRYHDAEDDAVATLYCFYRMIGGDLYEDDQI
jgi:DNA polymerase-3 subunit epsilon